MTTTARSGHPLGIDLPVRRPAVHPAGPHHECDVASPLVHLANHRDDVEAALADAVAHAREHGASWQTIGSLLGVSKQAAMKRYR